ncbi:MAG: transpeptidase family protein [Paludibacteraceae bacterium]|nr:transpeptidase family protein [Paludibacteraceae bacterium]
MRKRFLFLLMMLIMAFFIAAICKIIFIQTKEYGEWMKANRVHMPSDIELPAQRGDILSADGQLLATSMPYYYLEMDLRTEYLTRNDGIDFRRDLDSLSICLANFLGDKSAADYRALLMSGWKNHRAELRLSQRAVSYIELQEIKKFPLFRLGKFQSGLIPKEINKRINPFAPLAQRTIGNLYRDMEKGGSSGIERGFDSLLRGTPGMKLASQEIIRHPEKGVDVVMTLDMSIQEVASNALRNGMIAAGADKGCVVLMETATGDIKACVNLTRHEEEYYEEQNIALTEMMPPGSTFKTVSMLVAVEDGAIKPNDSVDTGTGVVYLYKHRIKDSHAVGKISAQEVIAASSNVGTALMIDRAYHKRPSYFVDLIRKTKIQVPMTNIGISGVARPDIRSPKDKNDKRYWSQSSLAVMSFGYETTVPPIYMVRFYNAIANHGKMINPKFVKELRRDGKVIETFKTEVVNEQICSEQTIQEITKMLEMVVNDKHGTGYGLVRSPYVRIAGKTGTATDQRPGHVGNYASFCGFFPSNAPKYTMYVMMHGGRIFGNQSGKVFRQIAESVYADNGSRQITEMRDTVHTLIPKVKGGKYSSVSQVMRSLGVKSTNDSITQGDGWVKGMHNDSTGLRLYTYNWQDEYVPNVVGIAAKDAIFILENCGLKVAIHGYGIVTKQSVPAGEKLKPGTQITLTLER